MHTNPAFRTVPAEAMRAFARARGFGVLAVNGDAANDRGGPLVSHVPFLLSADGAFADLHLTRSNPIARTGGGAAVLAVSGPDGYVSPDWYGMPDQVPTWNYVAVHLRGTLEPLPDAALGRISTRCRRLSRGGFAPRRRGPRARWHRG
jgi:transcriptional regulator